MDSSKSSSRKRPFNQATNTDDEVFLEEYDDEETLEECVSTAWTISDDINKEDDLPRGVLPTSLQGRVKRIPCRQQINLPGDESIIQDIDSDIFELDSPPKRQVSNCCVYSITYIRS